MARITFNSNTTIKSADANENFRGTWSGEYIDANAIKSYHLGIPGFMAPYAGATAPQGWQLCDGRAVNRTGTYATLFAVIGTAYGAGDGSSTFNLPDLRSRVPVGVDATNGAFAALGQAGGEQSHTLSVDEMPSHAHSVYDPGHGHGIDPGLGFGAGPGNAGRGRADGNSPAQTWGNGRAFPSGTGIGIYANGGSVAHNNVQPYQTVTWIIKF